MFSPILRRCALGLALLTLSAGASAQAFPNKPVKLVVPYPAGAPVDNVARGLAEVLSALWGQPVLIDNRAGANEIVAASAVTKSAPDGYTLLLGTDAAYSQNAFLYNNLPYDAAKELAPISRVVFVNMVLIARGELPAAGAKDFVGLMKKEGAKRNYGSAGAGGNIDALFAGATAAIPHLKTGKVKVLGISGTKRAKALTDKAFLEKFVEPYGYKPTGETPQQFGEFLKRDSEANAARIKALGIKLDP